MIFHARRIEGKCKDDSSECGREQSVNPIQRIRRSHASSSIITLGSSWRHHFASDTHLFSNGPIFAMGLIMLPSPSPPLPPPTQFRFWLDEILWTRGHEAVHLAERVLIDIGGRRTGGPDRSKVNRHSKETSLGSNHMDQWEVLWTKSTYALQAARSLRPGQVVSGIVGLNCLTMKRRMQETLKAQYGQDAFKSPLMPLSFALPAEADTWLQHISGTRSKDQWWMLKTGQDAGRGLTLLPTHLARIAVEQGDELGIKHSHELKVIQRYVSSPLLLPLSSPATLRKKFHLRLWLLVTHHNPLQGFLHKRGLCLLSTEPYSPPSINSESKEGYLQPNQVTNLARNSSGIVWTLNQLWTHLDECGSCQKSENIWKEIIRGCGLALSSAINTLIEGHKWLRPSIDPYGFQLLGVDYMIDSDMRPWLLEFNSSPSIMTEHDDRDIRGLIYTEKRAMLDDLFRIIISRIKTPEEVKSSGSSRSSSTSEEGTEFIRVEMVLQQQIS